MLVEESRRQRVAVGRAGRDVGSPHTPRAGAHHERPVADAVEGHLAVVTLRETEEEHERRAPIEPPCPLTKLPIE